MSSHEMTLTFEQFTLTSPSSEAHRAFRLVMLPGELLRIPRKHREIRVVSGEAWVSHDGRDHALAAGDVLPLKRARHEALISAEGRNLLLEVI